MQVSSPASTYSQQAAEDSFWGGIEKVLQEPIPHGVWLLQIQTPHSRHCSTISWQLKPCVCPV